MKYIYIFLIFFIALLTCCTDVKTNDEFEIYSLILNNAEKSFTNDFNVYPITKKEIYTNYILEKTSIGNSQYRNDIEIALQNLSKSENTNISSYLKKLNIKENNNSKYKLSTIGFSNSKTFSVLYEHNALITLAGMGYCYILKKVNNNWIIIDRILIWIS